MRECWVQVGRWVGGSLLSASVLVCGASAASAPAAIEVMVRDSWTGLALPGARLRVGPVAVLTGAPGRMSASLPGVTDQGLDNTGRTRLALPVAASKLEVQAPGYAPLRVDLGPGATLPLTVWLDPERRPAVRALQPEADSMVLEGHVVDSATGRGLAGASIAVARVQTTSRADGSFALVVPAPAPAGEPALPFDSDLQVSAEGYKSYVQAGLLLVPGSAQHMILDLEPGQGERVERAVQKVADELRLAGPEPALVERDLAALAYPPGWEPPSAEALNGGEDDVIRGIYVPGVYAADGIRVGTGCDHTNCLSCPAVSAMSLETYVERGVDNEWLISWDNPQGSAGRHAFRAGAVAYRSYGVHYINNPATAAYNISGTTCHQAYDSSSSTQSRHATRFTHSVVLSRDGITVFRSEYSSENNALQGAPYCANADKSCGAGKCGSPSAGWPCLVDHPNCSARPCSGHGRGMCQFGSSFWAINSAKDYLWILDHYYNDNFRPSQQRSVYVEELTDFAVGRNADGRLEVFGRWSTDNSVRRAAQSVAGATTFGPWDNSLAGQMLSNAAVASNQDGRQQLMVRGTSNDVWTVAQNATGTWGSWTKLATISGSATAFKASSEPALVRNNDGRLQAFVRGTDQQLYTAAQTTANGSFGAWLALGGTCTTAPAAAVNQNGLVQVFVRGTDDRFYSKVQTAVGANTWSDWIALNNTGQLGSKPAVARNADGTLEVFARGLEESGPATYRIRQTAPNAVASWGAWTSMGDTASSAPAVVTNADGRIQVFVRSNSGELKTAQQSTLSGGYPAFSGLGGTCTSAPVAALNNNGRVQVFVRGLDRKVWSKVQASAGGAMDPTWYPLNGEF
jgi:hypothetical protein